MRLCSPRLGGAVVALGLFVSAVATAAPVGASEPLKVELHKLRICESGDNYRADTGNGYYGGLQMDLTFQRSYGSFLLRSKGTANRWTPYEQMWVAERAYESGRGFYPWPNTARSCGLI